MLGKMRSTSAPQRPYGGISASDRVAARRDRLLAAGLELYGTRGFAATGVKDLCRAAGLTDRYFYESFRDSRALFLAVFDGVTDELFAAVAAAVVDAGADAERQLRRAIETFIGALDADPRKLRVVFSEPAAVGPEAAAHMRLTLRRFAELVAATARQHVARGVSEDDVRLMALSLVGLLERVVSERQDGALDIPVDRLVDRCAALYLTLLRRPAERAASRTRRR
jgi:AcrR family transcriptional regulator